MTLESHRRQVQRRQLLGIAAAAAGSATAASLPRTARAQSHPRLTHATWGGGVGKTWKDAFTDAFEAQGGSPVRIIEVPNPEAQLRAQAGNPQYNTAIVTQVQAINLMRDGLIETFSVDEIPEMQNVDRAYWLTTPDNRLAGVTTYFVYYGIAVNKTLAKPADFNSWTQLADPRWKGKLSMTRPIYLSTYDLPIMARATGGSEKRPASGLQLIESMARNVLNMSTSLAQQNTMLIRGEIAAMPFYSGRVWSMRAEGHQDVEMVIPKEGALLVPYIVVVPKGVKNRDATVRWLNYMASAAPQERSAANSGYLPANRKAVMLPAARAGFGAESFQALRAQLYQPDWLYIARHHKETVATIEKMLAKI